MKRTALLLALLLCVGCVPGEVVVPTPTPPTPTPTPPTPTDRYERTAFEAVEIGDPATVLDTLPPPALDVQVGDKTLYSWVLDEPRPSGGYVRWEIHIEHDQVVASFGW